jgi:peptidyl-prolyl cis-trans isomerase D
MLDALRRGATGWIAKILLLVPLVIAFAVWGIGDVVRQTGGATVARIGKADITADEFQRTYQSELSQMSQQFGRRLTPEQARMIGLESRVLSRLIGTSALDQKARELGLSISEAAVANEVRNDPMFFSLDGKFSKPTFDAFLRQNGLSEQGYLNARRSEDIREQLTDSILAGTVVPQTMIDTLHKYREETRVIEFVTLEPAKIIKVTDPDDAKLKEYFEANKRRFVIPESKKIAALLLLKSDVIKRVTVPDDEIKSTYEAEKEKFNTPEKRRIQQITFPNKAAADAAFATLSKAKDFPADAAKLGFKETDFDLGLLNKRDMIDAKIADAAFALKKDELSKAVEGQFSVVLLRATEIVAGKQRTFDEVKGELKDRLAADRAKTEIQSIHDKIDDERSAGKTLKDTAAKFNLTLKEVAAIDRQGNGPDGKPVPDLVEGARLALAAFGGNAGNEADAIELGDAGYAWLDSLGTTPEKQKAFEDVQAEVKTGWLDTEKLKELGSQTAKFIDRATKGETLTALSKDTGGKVEKTNAITRSTSPQGLSQTAVAQAFALPKNGVLSSSTADNTSRTLMRVLDIIPAPAATPEQIEKIKSELKRQMQSDTLNAYVAGLQTQLGVNVNDAAVRQSLGLGQQGQ